MSVMLHGGSLPVRKTPRIVGVLLCCWLAPAAQAAVLGLVTDNGARQVAVFDAETDAIAAHIDSSPGNAIGDCAMSPRHALGITSNSAAELSFIELDGLAPRQTSLGISNLGVDLALSPDGDWLVSAGGGALAQPLSVVDTVQRKEVGVSRPFMDHTSVEYCDDATLLLTTSRGRQMVGAPDNALYRARLSAEGAIEPGSERLSSGAAPNNSVCAPGSHSGVLLDRAGGLTSFTLPDLAPAGTVSLAGMGLSAAFSEDGRRLYVRTSEGVEAFGYEPVTGALQRDWSRSVPTVATYFGMEQLAVHPSGDRLYLDGGNALLVLEAATGATLHSIAASDATGVCLASVPRSPGFPAPGGTMVGVAAP